jgi:hypothetical protein
LIESPFESDNKDSATVNQAEKTFTTELIDFNDYEPVLKFIG